jgi:predicted RecB family nuclease
MYRHGDQIVLSPTDVTKHLTCAHITTLNMLKLDGHASTSEPDEALELIFRLGLEHEADHLERLRAGGLSVVEIPGRGTRPEREAATLEAMRAGVDVIYQGVFFDGSWGGQPDFLVRVDAPSALGDWSYEIEDTKLARKLKVPALLQMAAYAERLEYLQHRAPRQLYVVTGDKETRPWRLLDVAAYARRVQAKLRLAVEQKPPTEAVPVTHCGQCNWLDRCGDEWRRNDDLSLVAFMRADHREQLRQAGIATMGALALLQADELPRRISRSSRERLTHQARLQVWEKVNKRPKYELLAPAARTGLLRLPPPDEGDLYLDFEGDPYAAGGAGREYLAGIGGTHGEFTPLWAHSHEEERQLTIDVIDRLLGQWHQHPQMHVYHYAPYETTALKRLVDRHRVREAELDQLLRGEVFIDLYAVVRQGLRISKGSYSIKKMEAFYWDKVRGHDMDVADAMSSVIAYERWLVDPDPQTLLDIERYNRKDVESTLALHQWLEQRRVELEQQHGPQPRPADQPADPARPPGAAELAERALAKRLTEAGEYLLAGLVQFHRREARPAYWEIFRLEALDEDELVDDPGALGGLGTPVDVGTISRSRLYRYEFPAQDTKIKAGDAVYDVDELKGAGTVHEIDAEAGFVVLKRQAAARVVRGLTEKTVLGDTVIRDAIAAVSEDRLAGRNTLGTALLDRHASPALTTVLESGLSLDGQVLAVQGPPGTGKTTQGAELVRALLDAGKTVGITAMSHEVIGGFLTRVGRDGVQRCDEDKHCGSQLITRAESTDEVVAALDGGAQLIGGTSWLWCDERLQDRVDVLLIDEAGQFSLANAIGVSRAARSMILLGDPQQLAQVTQTEHPDHAGRSALAHMLDGHDTMPPGRGLFLGMTHRMHPTLTDFVSDLAYDSRLQAADGLAHQQVTSALLSGSGLRAVSVQHAGNAAASAEEVAEVQRLWHAFVSGTFTDRNNQARPMTVEDVLIVAPYNNQVGLLRQALPQARVGTVDKFQGKQAPVVIYSMTSSSVEEAPRGVGFLYDIHRLNVAISRAQALAVVVHSPMLLDAPVADPVQLTKVNALCRLIEVADAVDSGDRSALGMPQ